MFSFLQTCLYAATSLLHSTMCELVAAIRHYHHPKTFGISMRRDLLATSSISVHPPRPLYIALLACLTDFELLSYINFPPRSPLVSFYPTSNEYCGIFIYTPFAATTQVIIFAWLKKWPPGLSYCSFKLKCLGPTLESWYYMLFYNNNC